MALSLLLCAAAALGVRAASDWGRMALIPGGTRSRGSTPAEVAATLVFAREAGCTDCTQARYERELPARRVHVPAFWLDRYEVTNEEVAAWLNRRPGLRVVDGLVKDGEVLLLDLYHRPDDESYPSPSFSGLRHVGGKIQVVPGMERRPVVQITWHGARRYCADHGKRLPAEDEWEGAVRGPDGWVFPWGNTRPGCKDAIFDRKGACQDPAPGPAPVGSAAQDRTRQNVIDMAGNVREWVEDRFLHPDRACAQTKDCVNSSMTTDPEMRVIRGGSWFATAEALRAPGRSRIPPDGVSGDVGFRCARSLLPWPSWLRRRP